MSRLAFFDFDKTLLRKESGELIALPVGMRGLVHPWAGLRFIASGLMYKMGRVSREDMQFIGYATYRGGRLDRLISTLDGLWESTMEPGLSPAVLDRLRAHQALSHGCWVLTASPTYVAAAAKRALGVDGVVGTRMIVRDDGRLTGEPELPLMQGAEKARIAHEVAAKAGVELDQCWAYSDSMADVEMLEAVGNPVAVSPDPVLRELAMSKGWELLEHDTPRPLPLEPSLL